MVRLAPEDGDAVARLERREGTPIYFLRTSPGPDQYELHSRDEAVAQVLMFAKRAKLRAWLMNEGDDLVSSPPRNRDRNSAIFASEDKS